MAYSTYSILHVIGLVLMSMALGGIIAHMANGGTKQTNSWRKVLGITHGVGLFLSLLGGFGMLAKLSIHWPWPLWIVIKFAVWLALGAAPALIYRQKISPLVSLLAVSLIALIAIIAVNLKLVL